MSDNKRSSIAGKVATPRTGASSPAAQPLADPLDALAKAIGARVKLTTVAPLSQTLEGTLFNADPILNIVALNTRLQSAQKSAANTTAQIGDFTIIPVSKIQTFHVVALPERGGGDGFASAQLAITPVDLKAARAREESRVKQLKEEERNRGKGVTKEAQAIYDSFKRINMPIRWHLQEMIIFESVIIHPPYRVEDCKGPKDKQDAVNRVKKVLEGERRKLKEKEERERRAATPTSGPRKGG